MRNFFLFIPHFSLNNCWLNPFSFLPQSVYCRSTLSYPFFSLLPLFNSRKTNDAHSLKGRSAPAGTEREKEDWSSSYSTPSLIFVNFSFKNVLHILVILVISIYQLIAFMCRELRRCRFFGREKGLFPLFFFRLSKIPLRRNSTLFWPIF